MGDLPRLGSLAEPVLSTAENRTVDVYANYTECVSTFGSAACPVPGDTDAYAHEDWAERLGLRED